MQETICSHCPEETQQIAREFAFSLKAGDVVAFFGEMGAGKTTFIKAIAEIFGIPERNVSSPTFQYLTIHTGTLSLFHFDLYRLKGAEDFLALGFEEFFYKNGITCVEWSEKILSLLPKHAIRVSLQHEEQNKRIIIIKKV